MGIKGKINAHQMRQSHGASAKGLIKVCVAYQQHEREGVSQTEVVRHLCSHLFCYEISEFRSKQMKSNNI